MAIIEVVNYKELATEYAAASAALVGISDRYYNAAYVVVLLNVFDPEIDLLVPFHNAYLTSQTVYASPFQNAILAVKALQDHILARGASGGNGAGQTLGDRFLSVNEWYADEDAADPGAFASILDQEFADISNQAGHTIESTYIA